MVDGGCDTSGSLRKLDAPDFDPGIHPELYREKPTGNAAVVMARQANPAFGRIVDHVLPAFIENFAQHAIDYEDNADDLGLRGQYADLHGKIRKLKRAIWDGVPLVGEQPKEIVEDMIAHCLLMLDMMGPVPVLEQD